MAEPQNGSPMAFRHDSMLRVVPSEGEASPQASPPKKPRTDIPKPKKLNGNQRTKANQLGLLHSGTLGGTEFAVLCLNEPIVLSGCAWLSVLRRGVRVFGLTMSPDHHPIFAVSAPFAPLILQLTPCDPHADESPALEEANGRRNPGPAALIHEQIRDSLGEVDIADAEATIVLITSCPRDEQMWRKADGYPESDDMAFSLSETLQYLSIPNLENFASVVPSMRISRSLGSVMIFEEWANWGPYCREIDAYLKEHPKSDLRILVSGAGGSGKSTFVRCISNYLTATCGGLVLIETDVGQPELNLAGLVAAHHVSELHIGSALAHVRGVPIAARLLGETTPRDNPDFYEACVASIAKVALAFSAQQGLPVVINTDGWVTGTGSALLDTVFEQTRPSHAVRMFTGRMPTNGLGTQNHISNPEMKISYIERPSAERRSLYARSTARELQIATYFCKELSLGRVRAVSMELISVYTKGKKMDDAQRALVIMNGSIVAIGTSNMRKPQQAIANILGYGLVRGVSLDNRIAYISSPLPLAVLKQSNAIFLCEHIHVPNAVMLAVASRSSDGKVAPFLLRDHVDGSHHMHSRSSLQRRTTNVAEG